MRAWVNIKDFYVISGNFQGIRISLVQAQFVNFESCNASQALERNMASLQQPFVELKKKNVKLKMRAHSWKYTALENSHF